MSLGLAPGTVVPPRVSRRVGTNPRPPVVCVSSHRSGGASGFPSRRKTWSSNNRKGLVSWTSPCVSKSHTRGKALTTRAGSRYKDETERQRAIDRLSPKQSKGDGGVDDDDQGPPPVISRPVDKTRPKRFKDAVRDRVDRNVRRANGDKDTNFESDLGTTGPDYRENARLKRLERAQKRLESAEAASADRQAYLVAVIREELGRPSALLQLDGNTRDKRFASCFHRLRNFGGVEIAFGLVKYYDKHWDETEQRGLADDAAADETEVASSFASRKKKNDLDEIIGDESLSSEQRERASWAKDALGGESSPGASGDESGSDEASDVTKTKSSDSASDEENEKDEKTTKRLLRAAQLKATGVSDDDPRASVDWESENSEKEPSVGELLDALADLARSYFSIDFVDDDKGGKEMVVMTSPEFLGVFLVAIILAGRVSHWVVATYLATPVDALLR